MLKKSSICGLMFIIITLQGCNSVISQNVKAIVESETPKPRKEEVTKSQNIEFKGVSFSYNRQILGEAKAEEVAESPLENETDKPDSVAPKHLLFKLKNSKLNRDAVVYVFPIEDYRRMYPFPSKVQTYREQFDEELRGLQKVLEDKNYRKESQIPFIPFWDGSQSFQQKVKHFSFQSGKGIFFLTQFDIEPSLINNEGLSYTFQGITDDGKKYILAVFPVGISFLPKDYRTNEFEGYKLPAYFTADKSNEKRFNEYISKIAERLEKLPQNEFEPHLIYFEELISSLKVEN